MIRKYLVTGLFVLLLAVTVVLMMRVEDSIRQEKIVVIDSTRVYEELLPAAEPAQLQRLAAGMQVDFRVEGDYFAVRNRHPRPEDDTPWQKLFLKGVNLGAALPGKFPSEFPSDYQLYYQWIEEIGAMQANVIRTYTILPPVFYEALARYNLRNADNPVYLMQGVWATVPDDHDYFDEDYTYAFQREIRDVMAVIHGNAVLPEVRGKAHGTYVTDVSAFTIAWLLGREWEPQGVTITNQKHHETAFHGDFISVVEATPMEVWLARQMEFTLTLETLCYSTQRPVSFVNWLPLDPMHHNSEFIENDKVREYDNDLESIDFRSFHTTPLARAGLYAAYHAYPYYPDFVYLDARYRANTTDNYLPYIQDLKDHCPDMPLIIAEYGVPSSRGNSHYSPFGYDQGGHNEAQQAAINSLLTSDIHAAGCGGAIMFEWIDEWFKFNWMVMDFEQPQHRRKYWHNKENPEQNFGVVALENSSRVIDGSLDDWDSVQPMQAAADPSYFYLACQLDDFDFTRNNLHIAIDTYSRKLGDHVLPITGANPSRGIEFLLSFVSPDSARILVDDYYSVFSDIYNDYIPVYASQRNDNGRFVDQELIANRPRQTLLGEDFPQILHNRSALVHDLQSDNSNADWYYNVADGILELRLPWHLLNVSDPSSLQVLDDKAGTPEIETSTTDGFRIYGYITDAENLMLRQLHSGGSGLKFHWKGWEEPEYETRFKPQYYALQELFGTLLPLAQKSQPVRQNRFSIAPWYQDRPGAVSISFDDGEYGQYQYAFGVLEKYHLKGTFGIVGEWMAEEGKSTAEEGVFSMRRMGWPEVRELAAAGHEISSHGYLHRALDASRPQDELVAELKQNRDLIARNIGRTPLTLHYPYSHCDATIAEAAQKSGFLFGRVGDAGSANNTANARYQLSSKVVLNGADPSQPKLQNWIDQSQGDWLIMMYHHIFPDSSKAMKLYRYHDVYNQYAVTPQLFDNQVRLLRNSDYWIAPIATVGTYVMERDNARLEVTGRDGSYVLTLRSNLDASRYDQPLTVIFETDWNTVKIRNSEADGVYSVRQGRVLFPAQLNKKIIIERIQ